MYAPFEYAWRVPGRQRTTRDRGLIASQRAPGETNDLVAQKSEVDIPGAVLLERRAGSVCVPAIDFDDEALFGPVEVDLVSGNPNVDLGLGKAVATAEREHLVLELRSRAVGFGLITDRQAEELGLAEGGGELGWGKEGTEVGERARDWSPGCRRGGCNDEP